MPSPPHATRHPTDLHVGVRLRMRRTQLRMTQSKLAEALGVTFQQVQKYERGANRISASKLLEAAHVMGVPIGYFFEGLPAPTANLAPSLSDPMLEFAKLSEGPEFMALLSRLSGSLRRHLLELIRVIASPKAD